MEKIFYVKRSDYPSSESAVKKILVDYFGVNAPVILRTENGKPYLQGGKLYFSVAHTGNDLFIAVCDEDVGIDVENLEKSVDYPPIIKRFSVVERNEITDKQAFLRNFTAKESAVKWFGGTLARDFRKLAYIDGKIYYGEMQLPAVTAFIPFRSFILAVTSMQDFSGVEVIIL